MLTATIDFNCARISPAVDERQRKPMQASHDNSQTNSSTPSDAAQQDELTDEQWVLVAPLITTNQARINGRGRPYRDAREVLNGVLYVLRSNERWKDLPKRFHSYQ